MLQVQFFLFIYYLMAHLQKPSVLISSWLSSGSSLVFPSRSVRSAVQPFLVAPISSKKQRGMFSVPASKPCMRYYLLMVDDRFLFFFFLLFSLKTWVLSFCSVCSTLVHFCFLKWFMNTFLNNVFNSCFLGFFDTFLFSMLNQLLHLKQLIY